MAYTILKAADLIDTIQHHFVILQATLKDELYLVL